MEFIANEGKKVEIEVQGEKYLRHAIKTRFVFLFFNDSRAGLYFVHELEIIMDCCFVVFSA